MGQAAGTCAANERDRLRGLSQHQSGANPPSKDNIVEMCQWEWTTISQLQQYQLLGCLESLFANYAMNSVPDIRHGTTEDKPLLLRLSNRATNKLDINYLFSKLTMRQFYYLVGCIGLKNH